jgi:hypothetical protein
VEKVPGIHSIGSWMALMDGLDTMEKNKSGPLEESNPGFLALQHVARPLTPKIAKNKSICATFGPDISIDTYIGIEYGFVCYYDIQLPIYYRPFLETLFAFC